MTKIRELRISREISQKEFAEAIGVPANTLCQWETGKRAPDYEMLKKISAYFGVSVDYLLDNNGLNEYPGSSLISKFGDRIKQLRIDRGLTQKEMSDKLGVSPSAIGMYEQNRREPDANTIVRFSELFNVSTDYLLDRSDESLDDRANGTITRLRELRKTRGITAKELGHIINVAESTVSLYENGKRAPDYGTLLKIADYFNVSTDYLLGRDEKEKPVSNNELRSDPPSFKKPAPWFATESVQQDREFIELYSKLPPEERKIILDLIKNFASNKT